MFSAMLVYQSTSSCWCLLFSNLMAVFLFWRSHCCHVSPHHLLCVRACVCVSLRILFDARRGQISRVADVERAGSASRCPGFDLLRRVVIISLFCWFLSLLTLFQLNSRLTSTFFQYVCNNCYHRGFFFLC